MVGANPIPTDNHMVGANQIPSGTKWLVQLETNCINDRYTCNNPSPASLEAPDTEMGWKCT